MEDYSKPSDGAPPANEDEAPPINQQFYTNTPYGSTPNPEEASNQESSDSKKPGQSERMFFPKLSEYNKPGGEEYYNQTPGAETPGEQKDNGGFSLFSSNVETVQKPSKEETKKGDKKKDEKKKDLKKRKDSKQVDLGEEELENEKLDVIKNELPTPSLKVKALALNKVLKGQKVIDKDYKKDDREIAKKSMLTSLKNYNTISDIVTGNYSNLEGNLTDKDYASYKISKTSEKATGGIDYYWKTCIVNCQFFEINDKDKEVLNYLTNISFVPDNDNYPDFKLVFSFSKNTFFSNETLEKEYFFESGSDTRVKSFKTTEIDWASGDSDVTKKITTKKVKKGKVRETITKEKPIASFFNMFKKEYNPKKHKNSPSSEADFFKNDLLPNSLEYFLGILDIKEIEEEDDDEEEEEEVED